MIEITYCNKFKAYLLVIDGERDIYYQFDTYGEAEDWKNLIELMGNLGSESEDES